MNAEKEMVVGLTGGIASGKSLVSTELKRLGAHIIDADIIAREIVVPGNPAYYEIISEFGQEVLREDGTLNRKMLGSVVFADDKRLKALNSITHPRILKRIEDDIEKINAACAHPLIVVDIALLIELGFHKKVEKVIVVFADDDKLVKRMMARDNLTEHEAKQRLSAQLPMKEKLRYADYVIDNNGSVEEAQAQVKKLHDELSGA